jgi:hypothetical protein
MKEKIVLENIFWRQTTIQFLKLYGIFNMVRNGSERLKKAVFCVRNGSVMHREEKFAK